LQRWKKAFLAQAGQDIRRQASARTADIFVIESERPPQVSVRWHQYRCKRHFQKLTAWLRAKGVPKRAPLHCLRKEYGSMICKFFGIYSASAMLRHSNLQTTVAHYVDHRTQSVLKIGHLFKSGGAKVIPMQPAEPQQSMSWDRYRDCEDPAAKSNRLTGRGIFTFPEKGRLVFSSSDNSDPRTNGRMYRIEVPHRLSGGVLMICLGAWLAILAIHLATLPDRQTALMVWRRSAGFALESLVRLVGKWPAIVLSIPSIYLLSSFSPLWKDVDALGQLLAPASALNILH
jgi:hypothetical protein